MRVVIVGAGSVGRSIGRELIHNKHQVLFIDKYADEAKSQSVPNANWLLADACETSTLREAGLEDCDVVVRASAQVVAAAVYGKVPLAALEGEGAMTIEGDRATFARFVDFFHLPEKAG